MNLAYNSSSNITKNKRKTYLTYYSAILPNYIATKLFYLASNIKYIFVMAGNSATTYYCRKNIAYLTRQRSQAPQGSRHERNLLCLLSYC